MKGIGEIWVTNAFASKKKTFIGIVKKRRQKRGSKSISGDGIWRGRSRNR